MRRIALLTVALGMLGATLAAGAAFGMAARADHSGHPATLTIRHQVRGCHTWSFGGAWKADQKLTLHPGSFLAVVDDDVMPHKLVQTAGDDVRIQRASMHAMHARAQLFFGAPGTYRFKTIPGEDYATMQNMKTVGEDNVLRLTVTVR
jgi:hypothetical protein